MEELYEDEKISKKINLEELYATLEDQLNKVENKLLNLSCGEENKILFGERRLLEYIHQIFSTISYRCYSIYHRILANYILTIGGNVISFNWDILFEEEMFDTKKWDYVDGYGFNPAGIIDKNKLLGLTGYAYKKSGASSNNIILKPHGSVNWYKSKEAGEFGFVEDPNSIYIGIPMTRKMSFRGATPVSSGRLGFRELDRSSNISYESLIVPPGRKRKRFRFVWDRIKNFLEDSDQIITIGFSFNDFDKYIIEEFRNIKLKDGLKIDIVNPDESSVDKYKNIFNIMDINRIFSQFSEYCQWITTQDKMRKFSSLL